MRTLGALILVTGLALSLPAHAAANAVASTFTGECAPNDGPALRIDIPYMADTSFDVHFWGKPFEEMAGGETLMIRVMPPGNDMTSALRVCHGTLCSYTSAQIRIGQYKAGQFMDGELIWQDQGDVKSIPFSATYIANILPCG